jgi:hypothetical protein
LQQALRYLARYIFKTATGNRTVRQLADGRLHWPYRASRTQQDTAVHLQPTDFMARFLQHVLPPYFAPVRTSGWLHPAAKVRLNCVRALLGEKPLLTPQEQDTWQPPDSQQAPTATPRAEARPTGATRSAARCVRAATNPCSGSARGARKQTCTGC